MKFSTRESPLWAWHTHHPLEFISPAPIFYPMSRLISLFMVFRQRLGVLWRAFLHPKTPLYLKAIMVAVTIYLFSPVDMLPDFFVILGWVDDMLLVTLAMNWIIKRLPSEVLSGTNQNDPADPSGPARFTNDYDGPVINGNARRN